MLSIVVVAVVVVGVCGVCVCVFCCGLLSILQYVVAFVLMGKLYLLLIEGSECPCVLLFVDGCCYVLFVACR